MKNNYSTHEFETLINRNTKIAELLLTTLDQGYYARKDKCSCVYSAYILKPVLPGRNMKTRIDASVFVKYPRRLKALNFDNFDNSHDSFL